MFVFPSVFCSFLLSMSRRNVATAEPVCVSVTVCHFVHACVYVNSSVGSTPHPIPTPSLRPVTERGFCVFLSPLPLAPTCTCCMLYLTRCPGRTLLRLWSAPIAPRSLWWTLGPKSCLPESLTREPTPRPQCNRRSGQGCVGVCCLL